MSESFAYLVAETEAGRRLDRFLRDRLAGVPRRDLEAWIRAGGALRNGRAARKGTILDAGDRVELRVPGRHATRGLEPDPDLGLSVLFQDDHLVAVDKPPGVATHPLRSGERGTVANALVVRYPEMSGIGFSEREAGLVHRLDRDTSGVLLAARTRSAFEGLRTQFEQGLVVKAYVALVHGVPPPRGVVDRPIGARTRRSARVEVVPEGGRPDRYRHVVSAETRYRVIRSAGGFSLVRVTMTTGARHQIRAHMAFLGHPVVGDRLYGGGTGSEADRSGSGRHLLHSTEIRFLHPATGKEKRVRSPVHEDLGVWMRGDPPGGPPRPG